MKNKSLFYDSLRTPSSNSFEVRDFNTEFENKILFLYMYKTLQNKLFIFYIFWIVKSYDFFLYYEL